MSKLIESMMGSTAAIPSARVVDPSAPKRPATPVTAPGITGQLAGARTRIQELESQLSNATDSRAPLDSIVPNPWQPRRRFSPEALSGLATSIKEKGVIQPVLVRVNPLGSSVYQIVAGERRFRASLEAGLADIPIRIVELTDEEMAVWALAENLNREDLSDYEVSRGVRAIQESYAEPVRVDHLAAALGMSRTQMYRYRAYDALPQPIHDTLAEHPDLLSASHAEAIAGLLKDKTIAEAKLLAAWSEFVSNGFSQKDLITRLRRVDKPVTEAPAEHHLERNGSRVGRMTNNGKTLAITLRSDALSADKQKKLMKFLETLLH